jgi:hypothetical protein
MTTAPIPSPTPPDDPAPPRRGLDAAAHPKPPAPCLDTAIGRRDEAQDELMKALLNLFYMPSDELKAVHETGAWPERADDLDDMPEFNPQPVELDLDETRVRAEILRTAIQDDNAEIARLTGLRDQHLVMLAGEEAKAKVLSAFAERTIEAGKTQIAAE